MRASKLDRLVVGVLGVSLSAVALMLLLDRAIGVRVADTFPTESRPIAATTRVGIRFAEPMLRESVEPRFSLDPAMAGSLEWSGDTLWFRTDLPFEPGVTYRARISPGAVAESGRRLKREVAWSFEARRPGIAYMAPAGGRREIWLETAGGELRQVTHTEGSVFDFAISPDGEQFVYSVINELGGADLWIAGTSTLNADLLVDCGADRCTVPDWSPEGNRIAFSREQVPELGEGALGPPRLWTVNPKSGQAAAVYQDLQVLGHGPRWSPEGGRLAFFDGNIGGIRILEIEGGDEQVLPTRMGTVGEWSPDGGQMMFNVLAVQGESVGTALRVADLDLRSTALLEVGAEQVLDLGLPAWSPTGDWLVIGLQVVATGPGRQLWLMRPDGSEARALITNPDFTHGGVSWDPWGDRILYQRLRLRIAGAHPELRVFELASGEDHIISENASSGVWVP